MDNAVNIIHYLLICYYCHCEHVSMMTQLLSSKHHCAEASQYSFFKKRLQSPDAAVIFKFSVSLMPDNHRMHFTSSKVT